MTGSVFSTRAHFESEILVARSDGERALREYNHALQIAQKSPTKDDERRQQDIAFIENKIGDIFLAKEDWEHSLERYRAALAIGDQLLANAPENPDRQKTVADARMRIW